VAHKIFDTPGLHYITAPQDVTEMWWTAQGGGGGGGGGNAAAAPDGTGGAGGGPGGYVDRWRIYVEPDTVLEINVGMGGAGGAVGQLGKVGSPTFITGASLPIPVARGGGLGSMGSNDGSTVFTAKGPVTLTQANGDPLCIGGGPWYDIKPHSRAGESHATNTGVHATSLYKMISGSGPGRAAEKTYKQAGRSRSFVGLGNVEGGGPGMGGGAGGCSPVGDGGAGGDDEEAGHSPPSGHYGGGGGGGGRNAPGGQGAGGVGILEW